LWPLRARDSVSLSGADHHRLHPFAHWYRASQDGDSVDGFKARIALANAAGGVNGTSSSRS
jgi:hypothetical protein